MWIWRSTYGLSISKIRLGASLVLSDRFDVLMFEMRCTLHENS